MNTTTATDWLSAIGGILTALIALYLLGREEFGRRRVAKDERRRQASKVSISKHEWGPLDTVGDEFRSVLKFTVRNKSEDIISRTFIDASWFHNDHPAVVPGEVYHHVGRVDGESEEQVVIDVRAKLGPRGPVEEDCLAVHAVLRFDDAAGREWQRDDHHRLMEAEEVERQDRRRRRRAQGRSNAWHSDLEDASLLRAIATRFYRKLRRRH